MRRGLPALLVLVAACSSPAVDLDVSTSVLDIATTSTTTVATTTASPVVPTTRDPRPEPVRPDVATVVPIRPVLISDDDGSGLAEVTADQIVEWVNKANDVFEPARFGFSFDPNEPIATYRDTLLTDFADSDGLALLARIERGNEAASDYPDELVVFFNRGPVSEEVGSYHLNFVMMGDRETAMLCDAPDPGLLAHRIGLHLALPHTFAALHDSLSEAADTLADALQNPEGFDGDGFDDTLPDPGVYDGLQCSPESSLRVGGLDFELPRENIMSHYQERSALTLDQAERARWMLELRRANGMAVPSNTQAGDAIEAEEALVATRGRCGLGSLQSMSDFVGYQWFGSDQLLQPSEEGCTLDFELTVPEGGRYELIALATRSPESGAVDISVEGERFRFEDLYAPVVVATGPLLVGETSLEPGTVLVSLTVVGTNARSSGSSVGVDGFILRRLDP